MQPDEIEQMREMKRTQDDKISVILKGCKSGDRLMLNCGQIALFQSRIERRRAPAPNEVQRGYRLISFGVNRGAFEKIEFEVNDWGTPAEFGCPFDVAGGQVIGLFETELIYTLNELKGLALEYGHVFRALNDRINALEDRLIALEPNAN